MSSLEKGGKDGKSASRVGKNLKMLIESTVYLALKSTVLFTYLVTVSIKHPAMDIWKKSQLNDQY